MSAETLKLYSAHLAEFDPANVRIVVSALAKRKRAEGETAFPSLGDLVEPLQRMRERQKEEQHKAERRTAEIEQFWQWAPWWMERTGNDEAELLRRFPGFKDTKPR